MDPVNAARPNSMSESWTASPKLLSNREVDASGTCRPQSGLMATSRRDRCCRREISKSSILRKFEPEPRGKWGEKSDGVCFAIDVERKSIE